MKFIAPSRRRFLKGATALALAAPSILRPSDAQIVAYSGVPFQQRYPVALDPTKTFLVDQNRNPCFACGDAPQFINEQLQKADIELYFSDRAARGINIGWWIIVEKFGSSNPPNDAFGNAPFSGGNFVGMSSQTAYWNYVDYIMGRALAYGFTMLMTPVFISLGGPDEDYYSDFYNLPTATIQAYGAFVGNRYKGFPNLIWVLGGDADPNNAASYAALNTLAVAIKAADPGHLMTLEASRFLENGTPAPNGGYSSVDAMGIAYGSVPSWLDINWIYPLGTSIPVNPQRCYSQGLPCLLGEDWYELEHAPTTTPQFLRGEAYGAVFGGCTLGRLFGNGSIWPFNSPNSGNVGFPTWQSQLSSVGSVGQQLMGRLLRSREWQKLVPDLTNVVMTVGAANGSICARTNDGQSILAYLPSSQTVTMAMTKIADSGSQANCNWYDPTNGAVTNIGTFANTGTKTFTTPGNNNNGDPDWVLVIDSAAANLRTPGT